MPKLKLEFMPEATQKNFVRLKDDPRLAAFTLVGGTALALQIGHRISEDLDFNIFGQKLPTSSIDGLLDELAASGATIMLFTVLEDTGNSGRGSKLWQERFGTFNNGVREIAAEVGAIIIDANSERFFSDKRFLAFDRLHLNEEGHKRCADAVLEKLGYEFDPGWRTPLPPAKATPWIKERAIGVIWFFTFALPWIIRRLRGRSSGDGRVCKYPTPISWPR